MNSDLFKKFVFFLWVNIFKSMLEIKVEEKDIICLK